MWRAHHRDVVTEFRGVLGEAQCFDRGLDSGTRDQHFIRGGGSTHGLQHIAPFLVGEQNGFTSRAFDDDACHGSAGITLDVGFKLFEIDLTVRIERRGDRRKNTV